MIDIYIVSDRRTTPEAVANIPHLVGKPQGITFYTPNTRRRGYALLCHNEDFAAVKDALRNVCDAGVYSFSICGNAYAINFQSHVVQDTRTRMVVADCPEKGIAFDNLHLWYEFIQA